MLKMHKMYKFLGKVWEKIGPTFPGNLYILYIFNISRAMLKLQFSNLCIFNISLVLSTFGWKMLKTGEMLKMQAATGQKK